MDLHHNPANVGSICVANSPSPSQPAGLVDAPFGKLYFVASMRPKDLEDALTTTPFMPLDIHVNGRTIRVGHPEQVMLTHGKTTAVVAPADDRIHILSVSAYRFFDLAPPPAHAIQGIVKCSRSDSH